MSFDSSLHSCNHYPTQIQKIYTPFLPHTPLPRRQTLIASTVNPFGLLCSTEWHQSLYSWFLALSLMSVYLRFICVARGISSPFIFSLSSTPLYEYASLLTHSLNGRLCSSFPLGLLRIKQHECFHTRLFVWTRVFAGPLGSCKRFHLGCSMSRSVIHIGVPALLICPYCVIPAF